MMIGMRLREAPTETFWERLCFAREHGFGAVYIDPSKDLPQITPVETPSRLDDHVAVQVRCALRLTGMRCAAVGCACDVSAPNAEAVYRAHMRFARAIGAAAVCPESPGPIAKAQLQRLTGWAAEAGVALIVDPAACPDGGAFAALRFMPRAGCPEDTLRRLDGRVCALSLPVRAVIAPAAHRPLLRFAAARNLPVMLEGVTEDNADAIRRCIEARNAGMSA